MSVDQDSAKVNETEAKKDNTAGDSNDHNHERLSHIGVKQDIGAHIPVFLHSYIQVPWSIWHFHG
jgi:hypothetical protein